MRQRLQRKRQKNKFVHGSRFYVHFLAVFARLRHETSQIHMPALWSTVGEQNTKIFFFFF